MLPERSKQDLCQVVAEAEEMAARGNVASGMALLAAGALRAQADRDTGEPWAERLIECYDRAMDRYAVDHLHPRARSGQPDIPVGAKKADGLRSQAQ